MKHSIIGPLSVLLMLGGCCANCRRPAEPVAQSAPAAVGSSATCSATCSTTCSGGGWVETDADGVILTVHGPVVLTCAQSGETFVVQAGEVWHPTSTLHSADARPAG